MAQPILVEVDGQVLEFPPSTPKAAMLSAIKSRRTAPVPSPLDLSGLVQAAPAATDNRSGLARAVDAASRPLVPQIATGGRMAANLIDTANRPETKGGDLFGAVKDVASNLIHEPVATLRGGAAGVVEGAGNVLASFTSPLNAALTVASFGAGPAASAGLPAVARALRGAETVGGALVGARGLEQAARATDPADFALGIATAAGGALGTRAGVQGLPTPSVSAPVSPVIRGELPPGPRFMATADGVVVPYGTEVPPVVRPDSSFTRVVRGEYARREPAGLLPPAEGFIVASDGRVARAGTDMPPLDLAGLVREETPRRVEPETPMRVERAVPLAYEFVPTRSESGRASQRLVPSQFSSDINAVAAPKVEPLTSVVREALHWIKADLENVPFSPRTFVEPGARRGGTLEVTGGSAGAPIYSAIVGEQGSASRGDVIAAIDGLLAGTSRRSPLGDAVLDVAGRLGHGNPRLRKLMQLPPEAGRIALAEAEGRPAPEAGFDRFADAVDTAAADAPVSSGREPGQEGFISPALATRLGGGAVGAVVGAATGDTSEERVKRALLFGAAGAVLPSLLESAPMAASGAQRARLFSTDKASRTSVPRTEPIASGDLRSMPALTPDVQAAADQLASRYGGFEAQRRGVQTKARTEALADRERVKTDEPVTPGTAMNAERIRAYQNTAATLLRKQRELEAKVQAGAASPADELALETTKSEAAVVTASLRGAAAEAGRALHILRFQARILASGDPEAMAEAARLTRSGLASDVERYYYANILSGIGTHERNFLGNLSNALYGVVAQPFAVGADVVRSAVTGAPREMFLAELPARVSGAVAAMPRAFANALHVLQTGLPPMEVVSADRPVRVEFKGGGANPFNWPSRALDAADDLFSTVAHDEYLYGAAVAQAAKEGARGDAFLRRVADLKANPTDAMLQEVEALRTRQLFREEPGRLAKAVLAAKKHVPVLAYVVPFVRVPANIIRQGVEASPAGFGMKAARAGGRLGADAMGRAALGTVALGALSYWAALGKITGDAPSDPAKRAAFYESGMRPNSVKIGDTWYSYQPIQPLNVPLALVANGFQRWREASGDPTVSADRLASEILGRTASSLLDQSFLSGVSALVDALNDPDRYGQRFLQQTVTGFVPFSGAMRTTAQAVDPVVRDVNSVSDAVTAITPGQSASLPPRRTRFGEPVARVEGSLNVFKPSPEVIDPIAAVMQRAGVDVAEPKGSVTVRGKRLALTPDQQQVVIEAIGRQRRTQLAGIANRPDLDRIAPEKLATLVRRALETATDVVHARVRGQFGKRELTVPSLTGAAVEGEP